MEMQGGLRGLRIQTFPFMMLPLKSKTALFPWYSAWKCGGSSSLKNILPETPSPLAGEGGERGGF